MNALGLDIAAQHALPQREDASLKMLHVLIIAACALGFSFDMAEIAFGTILSAVFSAPPYSVDKAALSWLLSAMYIGAIVGAPLFGWLADRFGKRLALIWLMADLALSSMAAAWAPNIGWLIAFRIASGLALGAYPPIMFSYLTDVLPASGRGKLVMITTALGYAGPTAFIFFVRWLTPLAPMGVEAWRWGFIAGSIGAGCCTLMFTIVPESVRWLNAKGRIAEARVARDAFDNSRLFFRSSREINTLASQTPIQPSSQPRSYGRTIAFLMAIYFLTPWATVGFALLSGAVLVQKGINLQDSLLYLGISTLGPIFGTVLGGFFIDKIERRNALIANALAMAAIGLLFGAGSVPIWLISCGVIFNLLVSLFLPVLILYAAEMVPSYQRGTATSLAWTANRVGSALTPLALLPVLQSSGPVAMFAVIAVTLMVFVVLVAMFGPMGKAGRQLN